MTKTLHTSVYTNIYIYIYLLKVVVEKLG